MKAAFLNKPCEIEIREIEIPEPKFGEVRIKIKSTGVCGSDIHLFLGHRLLNQPTLIGHEGLGIIDKIGEGVKERSLGERVVVEPNIPCLTCVHCRRGNGNICLNKRVVGVNEPGCFAEYICLPQEYCWKLPDEVSDADAVTIEPMAVAYHALFSSNAQPGDTIAVIGLGAIGLLLTHLAVSIGYKVFVTEINDTKLALAKELGAVIVSSKGDTTTQTIELTKCWAINDIVAVFECAGSNITASLAAAAAPRGSEIILVGLSEKLASFQPLKITREGIHIVPSIIYNHPYDFKRVLQLISAKIIRPGFIVSRTMSLAELQQAIELAAKGDESKIIIAI